VASANRGGSPSSAKCEHLELCSWLCSSYPALFTAFFAFFVVFLLAALAALAALTVSPTSWIEPHAWQKNAQGGLASLPHRGQAGRAADSPRAPRGGRHKAREFRIARIARISAVSVQ
jgi:hypothetical protein